MDIGSSTYERFFENMGELRSRPRGNVIVEEGESADRLFLLIEGQVEVYAANERGKEIIIAELAAGEIFGEMAIDTESAQARSASVRAKTAVRFREIPYASLLAGIASNPQLGMEMFFLAVRRARVATSRTRKLALTDFYGGLRDMLHGYARTDGDGKSVIDKGMSHAAIAARIGCTRHTVRNLIKALEEGGYLTYTRECITLHRRLPERF